MTNVQQNFFCNAVFCLIAIIFVLFDNVSSQEDTPIHVAEHPGPSTVLFDYGTVESLESSTELESNTDGIQHEFRISVGAGMSQCFYQRLASNAQLYVSFQVIQGSDRNIGFLVTGPNDLVVEHLEWTSDSSIQKAITYEGLYRFCLKNEKSHFASKLVHFYMISYVEENWQHLTRDIVGFFEGADGIQKSLDTVHKRMKEVHLQQALTRRHVISDWYIIQDNNSYVQTLSIILCFIIIATSTFQVYFVRRLFTTKSEKSSKSCKPRA